MTRTDNDLIGMTRCPERSTMFWLRPTSRVGRGNCPLAARLLAVVDGPAEDEDEVEVKDEDDRRQGKH